MTDPTPDAATIEQAAHKAVRPWPFFGYAPGHYTSGCVDCGEHKNDMDKLAVRCLPCAVTEAKATLARLDRMTEALNGIVSGDIPRPVANHWRRDCKPSKHDQCAHQKSMWEDCGQCVTNSAARALGSQVGEG